MPAAAADAAAANIPIAAAAAAATTCAKGVDGLENQPSCSASHSHMASLQEDVFISISCPHVPAWQHLPPLFRPACIAAAGAVAAAAAALDAAELTATSKMRLCVPNASSHSC